MYMAAVHAATLADVTPSEAAEVGPRGRPAAQPPRRGAAVRARELDGEWESIVDALYERYGALHWVHAINNAALVAAAMYRFTSFDEAVCAVVSGGWDTDTNGAAIGSVFGALGPVDARWTDPLHDVVDSSLPGFDRSSFGSLAARTVAGATLEHA